MTGRADGGDPSMSARLADELRRRGFSVASNAGQQVPRSQGGAEGARVFVDPDGMYRVSFSTGFGSRTYGGNHYSRGVEQTPEERRAAADREVHARAARARAAEAAQERAREEARRQQAIREELLRRAREREDRLLREHRARAAYDRLPPVEPLPLLRVPCTRGEGVLTRS